MKLTTAQRKVLQELATGPGEPRIWWRVIRRPFTVIIHSRALVSDIPVREVIAKSLRSSGLIEIESGNTWQISEAGRKAVGR